MNDRYIRLAEKPPLLHPGHPVCGACDVEVGIDDGTWLCGLCGTAWPGPEMEASADDAMLYPEWSGEELTGPICITESAWRLAGLPPAERDAWIRENAKATR